jgi:hypothetical protein
MAKASLAAALIVKDEETNLPDCLASLTGVVDEVVVYDTGSSDATVETARAVGARVELGYWDGDFARARNAAIAMSRSTWVLTIDADERVGAGGRGLRSLLASGRGVDAYSVRVTNHRPAAMGAGHEHPGTRILRRALMRYTGRVHEQPVRRDGRAVVLADCPRDVLRLDHYGYADTTKLKGKAHRNNEIAQASLDSIVAGQSSAHAGDVTSLLLHLGRSRRADGDMQGAVDALETLRQVAPGTRIAIEGTAVLAEILLDADLAEPALVLIDDLLARGAEPAYCDWLRAQAFLTLGRKADALQLLRGIDRLVDPAGRVRSLSDVRLAHANLAIRLRQQDEAIAALLRAMVEHGSVAGHGRLLLRLWRPRPPEHLARLLMEFGVPEHLDAAVAELRACPGAGVAVADALEGMRAVRA